MQQATFLCELELGTVANWATAAIAILALLQPHLINLYKKYFGKPKLTARLMSDIELGYVQAGPTLNLIGTLVVENNGCFVDRIVLNVTRELDGAKLPTVWVAFRSLEMLFPPQPITAKVATGVQVTPENPYPFNIYFAKRLIDPEASAAAERIQKLALDARPGVIARISSENPELPIDLFMPRVATPIAGFSSPTSRAPRLFTTPKQIPINLRPAPQTPPVPQTTSSAQRLLPISSPNSHSHLPSRYRPTGSRSSQSPGRSTLPFVRGLEVY